MSIGGIAVLCLLPGLVVPASRGTEPELAIRVNNQAEFDQSALVAAQSIVVEGFREVGVGIRWTGPGRTGSDVDVVMNLVRVEPSAMGCRPEAVGLAAVPKDGAGYLAWVFQPVLERVVDEEWKFMPGMNRGSLTSALLGDVMAHEIGHLLLGRASHGNDGIMAPHWTRKQLAEACTRRLRFSPRESRRLVAAIEARHGAVLARGGHPLFEAKLASPR